MILCRFRITSEIVAFVNGLKVCTLESTSGTGVLEYHLAVSSGLVRPFLEFKVQIMMMT